MYVTATTKFAETEKKLAEATNLIHAGKYAEALTCAYKTAEGFAAAYLLAVTGQLHPENDATYDLFENTIRNSKQHPAHIAQINDIVGDVTVLRETYVPGLLDETTQEDAQRMMNYVQKLATVLRSVSDCL